MNKLVRLAVAVLLLSGIVSHAAAFESVPFTVTVQNDSDFPVAVGYLPFRSSLLVDQKNRFLSKMKDWRAAYNAKEVTWVEADDTVDISFKSKEEDSVLAFYRYNREETLANLQQLGSEAFTIGAAAYISKVGGAVALGKALYSYCRSSKCVIKNPGCRFSLEQMKRIISSETTPLIIISNADEKNESESITCTVNVVDSTAADRGDEGDVLGVDSEDVE